MENQNIVLLGLVTMMGSIGGVSAFGLGSYVILSEDTAIVIKDGVFDSALIGAFEFDKADVQRERSHSGEDTRIFGQSQDGTYFYIIYGPDEVKAKVWASDGQQIRTVQQADIVPLF